MEDSSSFVSSSSEPKWRYRSERAVGGKGEAEAARDTQKPGAVRLRCRRMAQPAWEPASEPARHLGADSRTAGPNSGGPHCVPKAAWSQQEFMHLQGDVSRLSYIPVLHKRDRQGGPLTCRGATDRDHGQENTALHPQAPHLLSK